ncbi:3-oxoacyl-ACP reductase FabG [Ostreibacterium oceani]|uniref:3-oxoacyl-[acyl-carrier-protein] reductase n=1 Tax=Ostreibacterium oceani TaxID=2654998 RepID=A0A6N7F226_9GAMM|nr:3-oxoacyl-ACP reductase FabG [Ostreibacterium oceani]MPV86848.1 3-oxoacyl-ACP reductase FabG [Ostreibacterium oceani]
MTNEKPAEYPVVLVTGASRGIGATILEVMGKNGATVLGTATSESGVSAINERIKAQGLSGKGYVLNVADATSIEQCLAAIETDFGGIAVLVNNAGITRDNLLMRLKDEDWDAVIQTNLTSVYRLSKAVLRPMMKQKFGRIINIASVVGVTGNPGQTNYAAAKAGVIGFSKSLAREVASRGITVNTIAPGFIQTDMTAALSDEQKAELAKNIPAAKLGAAADIAHAVKFLASPEAGYVTGETLHINGGMYMG